MNTIADLQAEATRPDVVVVLGYYAAGDGGGGSYLKNLGSTETPNGGTVIQAGGGGLAGNWIRQPEATVNVRWFGATGDGSHDDTVSIQSAINWALVHTGSVIIPSGSYKLTDALQIVMGIGPTYGGGLIIAGEGGQTDLIQSDSNKCGFIIGSANGQEQRHIEIANLTLRPSSSASVGTGILAHRLCRSRFTSVYITAQEDDPFYQYGFAIGMQLLGVDDVLLSDCRIRGKQVAVNACGDGVYKANLFVDDGTVLGDYPGSVALRICGDLGGVYLNDCDIINCQTGLYVTKDAGKNANREFLIGSECSFDSCSAYGILVEDGSATHVTLTGTWFGSNVIGLEWREKNAILECTGCRVVNNLDYSIGFSIFFGGNGGNVAVNDCRFNAQTNNNTRAIVLNGDPSNNQASLCTITGNTIQNYYIGIDIGVNIKVFLIAYNCITGCNPLPINLGSTPDGQGRILRGNVGFTTDSTGVFPLGQNAASVAIPHNLGVPSGLGVTSGLTPYSVVATPLGYTSVSWYVGNFNSTTFTLYINGPAVNNSVPFAWVARAFPGC